MTKYLNRIRIDAHSQFEGHMTEVTDLASEEHITNINRIEIIIKPREPVIATLMLVEVKSEDTKEGRHIYASTEAVHCPEVDLLPLVALVEQVLCGKYRLDGNSWDRWPDGTISGQFKPVAEEVQS